MLRPRLLVAAILLSLAPGCAKMAARDYVSSAPDPGFGGGAAPPAPPVSEAESYRGDSDDSFAREEAPMEAKPTVLSAPSPPKTAPEGPKDTGGRPATASPGNGEETKEPPKQFARQIIYTADMTISCFKLDDAMKRAEALALESGGYVQTMSAGYFVLRIPAAKLRPVMDDLARLGVVESRSMQAQDVTQEYVDLQTRIRVLRETQSQLIALLKQARNVDEALNVRRSLDTITMELEQALGRLRMLENLIGFSTLTLRLSERGPQNAVPSSNDPFPWVDTLGVEATEWN